MSVYLAGAGGVGREALDVALAAEVPVAAFLDDHQAGRTVRSRPVLRPAEAPSGASYLVAIADPGVRRRLSAMLECGPGEDDLALAVVISMRHGQRISAHIQRQNRTVRFWRW